MALGKLPLVFTVIREYQKKKLIKLLQKDLHFIDTYIHAEYRGLKKSDIFTLAA